jgi:molecular chaperone DnaK (HSP70)
MRYIVIFDLGGGTFDVTVLCVEDGNNEVRSTSGDTHLGGSDIDNILLKHCIEVFKKET